MDPGHLEKVNTQKVHIEIFSMMGRTEEIFVNQKLWPLKTAKTGQSLVPMGLRNPLKQL